MTDKQKVRLDDPKMSFFTHSLSQLHTSLLLVEATANKDTRTFPAFYSLGHRNYTSFSINMKLQFFAFAALVVAAAVPGVMSVSLLFRNTSPCFEIVVVYIMCLHVAVQNSPPLNSRYTSYILEKNKWQY